MFHGDRFTYTGPNQKRQKILKLVSYGYHELIYVLANDWNFTARCCIVHEEFVVNFFFTKKPIQDCEINLQSKLYHHRINNNKCEYWPFSPSNYTTTFSSYPLIRTLEIKKYELGSQYTRSKVCFTSYILFIRYSQGATVRVVKIA